MRSTGGKPVWEGLPTARRASPIVRCVRRVLSWVIIAAVVAAVAWSATKVVDRQVAALDPSWREATGTVVEHRRHAAVQDERSGTRRRDTFSEIIAFEVAGHTYRTESVRSTDEPGPVGTARVVRYNPDDPSQAVIKGEAVVLVVEFAVGLAVVAVLVVAARLVGRMLRRRRLAAART